MKGQIVIPGEVRAGHKLAPGKNFTVLSRSNGDIILRPVKASRRHATLAGNLLALSGLELTPERGPARDLAV